MSHMISPSTQNERTQTWVFPKPFGVGKIILILLAFMLLAYTGKRVEMDKAAFLSADAIAYMAGQRSDSQVASGLGRVAAKMIPIVIAERTEISRLEHFDADKLPPFSHLETVRTKVQTLNPETYKMDTVIEQSVVLVEPYGYLIRIGIKLIETLEIALWGTVLSVVIGLPLAVLGARNLSPHPVIYALSRGIVSLLRAVPELISALFLVLAYGFGPIAGVLALALHASGFLGKFYAEDMENADPGPQEALRAIGCNRLKILGYAILPQVLPQYIAYTIYILDRNVRMATVIGLVGAGGIGQELKGRYDMYNYGHVGTILLGIFLLVVLLEQLSNRLRRVYL